MKIGFSGTRNGMTDAQRAALIGLFGQLEPTEFHHGACKGADASAAFIADDSKGVWIVAHPGKSAKGGENEWLDQCAMECSDDVRDTKTHFARNRDIVNETDLLIACPPCQPLPASGGTAYTVGYAGKVGKPVKIIWPSGIVEDWS